MTIATKAIPADAVAVSPEGLHLRVGLPWYRSLPWAGVEAVTLELDGVSAGPPVRIDGVVPDQVRSRQDYWSIQRWAVVDFADPGGVRPGDAVTARVRIELRVPGPLLPDGTPMPFAFDETRRVVIAEPGAAEHSASGMRGGMPETARAEPDVGMTPRNDDA